MPAPKNVVAAAEAVDKTPAPSPDPANAAPARVFAFWKRMNPFEKILFSDRSTFVFGAQRFVTADESLANKITEVADRYGILLQNNGE